MERHRGGRVQQCLAQDRLVSTSALTCGAQVCPAGFGAKTNRCLVALHFFCLDMLGERIGWVLQTRHFVQG